MERLDRITALTDELRRIAKELEQGLVRYDEVVNELRGIGLPKELGIGRRGRSGATWQEAAVILSLAPSRPPPLTTQILDLLSQTKRPLKPREITSEIHANPGSVRTTMGRLSKLNLVKRGPEGWYI